MNLKVPVDMISTEDDKFIFAYWGYHDVGYNTDMISFVTDKSPELFVFDTFAEVEQKIYELCNIYLPKHIIDVDATRNSFNYLMERYKLDVAKTSKRGKANVEIFDGIWVYSRVDDIRWNFDRPFYIKNIDDKWHLGLNPNFGLMGFIIRRK